MDRYFVEDNIEPVIAEFEHNDVVGLDIETTGLSPLDSRILLVQLAFEKTNKSFVIDHSRVNIFPILPFLADPKWKILIAQSKFEQSFMLYVHKTRIRNIFDVNLAEHLITSDPDLKVGSLETLALKYANVQLDKSVRKTFEGMKPMDAFTKEQIDYAADDAEIMFKIYREQEKILKAEGLEQVAEIEFELSAIVAQMELTGVPIDVKKWRGKIEDYKVKLAESDEVIQQQLLGDSVQQTGMFDEGKRVNRVNLRSHVQIKKAFAGIGVNLTSTDKRYLSLIDNDTVRDLLTFKKYAKILDAFGESILQSIHPFTGHIHPDWRQLGTETGRFSCEKPNFQQLPAEFRGCVWSPDYVLVLADYSQIELRILAELSGDTKLSDAFEQRHDVHRATASHMFNTPLDKVSSDQRHVAKTINFGLAYGMQARKFRDTLNKDKPKKDQIGLHKAQAIIDRHAETYGEATKWLAQAGLGAFRRGYSSTILGRKRYFKRYSGMPREEIEKIKRQGANAIIQGTSADITKIGMLNLYDDLKQYNYQGDIILQVHDEIVVLAHKRHAEAIKELMEESMIASGTEVLKKIPVEVEAHITDVWKKD